ncbi:ABC transporter ATP-binding protein [Limobrevibacterium gyesilva]|uniref:ABC transporter ATP-binding protein n=1 Tax=Limobrevibacterium gyesilva TaxID=2991712 RepID=A0AA41YN70_9PROT|nr:ABC transporter ATP-binding protein [Limobrevibacterium gyesilva]MCW3473588.1 ABC transporter ATP-binding protein [Limobrevibacterium gyesilva]
MNPVPPRLRLRGITKHYGATIANDGIDLAVLPGEIHALLGENGAGKSTLVKIIYGVAAPDAGEILWQGRAVAISDPNAARALGIGMVFQHFSLFETLTVAENIALGLGTRQDMAALAARLRDVAARYGLAVDPGRHVHHLSVGERQRVEILRCLLQDPSLLIMDEPTSVLTPQETEGLFAMLRRLAGEGCSILYISHKLEEIQALCHRATVLRAGRVVAECDPRTATPAAMAEMMIGGSLPQTRRDPGRAPAGPPCMVVRGLSLPSDDPFGTGLRDIAFALRDGEILGIAGVAGNGQKELLAALSGETLAARADAVTIAGRPVGRLGVAARRRLGLAFVPEERLGRGAVAELSLAENALLTATDPDLAPHGFICFDRLRRFAADVIAAFKVVAPGPDAPAGSLSGGNMQKFIIGREIGHAPRLLLAAHPTWGVDVGAAMAIHQALIDLAATGVGVLLVSEDLAELFQICDRIAVLHAGRLSPPRPVAETTVDAVGLLMGGMMPEAAHAA